MLPLCEDINLLVVISHRLVKEVALGTVVHALHYLLLTVYYLVRALLIDVTLKMVLVVRLPRLRAHVTEVFTAGASHEVAAH